jgi:hypothetical protein
VLYFSVRHNGMVPIVELQCVVLHVSMAVIVQILTHVHVILQCGLVQVAKHVANNFVLKSN